jgi:hypothetical protein
LNDSGDNGFKPVLAGLAALLGASLLIGAVVSAMALGVAGLVTAEDDAATSEDSAPFIPVVTAAPSQSVASEPARAPSAEASTKTEEASKRNEDKREDKKRERTRPTITLSASPRTVAPFGRIDLTGTYRGANGTTLQVQRFDGGWADFPVDAAVTGGTFSTWVSSGLPGQNRFRVLDGATGRASKPVTVTVR